MVKKAIPELPFKSHHALLMHQGSKLGSADGPALSTRMVCKGVSSKITPVQEGASNAEAFVKPTYMFFDGPGLFYDKAVIMKAGIKAVDNESLIRQDLD